MAWIVSDDFGSNTIDDYVYGVTLFSIENKGNYYDNPIDDRSKEKVPSQVGKLISDFNDDFYINEMPDDLSLSFSLDLSSRSLPKFFRPYRLTMDRMGVFREKRQFIEDPDSIEISVEMIKTRIGDFVDYLFLARYAAFRFPFIFKDISRRIEGKSDYYDDDNDCDELKGTYEECNLDYVERFLSQKFFDYFSNCTKERLSFKNKSNRFAKSLTEELINIVKPLTK